MASTLKAKMKSKKSNSASMRPARPSIPNLKNYQYPDLFGNALGYEIVSIDKDGRSAEAQLRIRENHLSPARRVHGGVISALFDFACGAAVFSGLGPDDFTSTVELKINYLRPLDLGDLIRVKAKVVFKGKRLCVLHAFAYRNRQPDPVAMASATFNIVNGSTSSQRK